MSAANVTALKGQVYKTDGQRAITVFTRKAKGKASFC